MRYGGDIWVKIRGYFSSENTRKHTVTFLLLGIKDNIEVNNFHVVSLVFCIFFIINHHFLLRRGHPTGERERAIERERWTNDEIYTSITLFK